MLGVIPEIYGWNGGEISLETYFAMARARMTRRGMVAAPAMASHGESLPALEMTKWFDTNYHYMVPEFAQAPDLHTRIHKTHRRIPEAKALGIHTSRSSRPP